MFLYQRQQWQWQQQVHHACIVAAVALIVAGLQKAVQHISSALALAHHPSPTHACMHFGEMLWVVSWYVHLFAQMKIKMFHKDNVHRWNTVSMITENETKRNEMKIAELLCLRRSTIYWITSPYKIHVRARWCTAAAPSTSATHRFVYALHREWANLLI